MANSVETLYAAKTGMTTISVPNSLLDGGGTINTIIVGSATGTFVKTLIIKAQTDTSHGMIRLFVKESGGASYLLREYAVNAVTKSARDLSYYMSLPLNYLLGPGEELRVSTEVGDTFNIIAEAFDLSSSTNTTYLGNTIEYIPNVGMNRITTANPNLNGSGSIVNIFTSPAGTQGSVIESIRIKAQQTVTPGVVRFYVKDNAGAGTPVLFAEVLIPEFSQSSTAPAFTCEVISGGSFCLQSGHSIEASTEKSDVFNVVVSANDWN